MIKDYTVSIANLKNKKSGCATFEDLALIIDEQAKEGFIFCAFIPSVIGPSGKVLTYDLIFKEADCKKFEYKIEYILADNKKAGEATFSGYNSALLSNVFSNSFLSLIRSSLDEFEESSSSMARTRCSSLLLVSSAKVKFRAREQGVCTG